MDVAVLPGESPLKEGVGAGVRQFLGPNFQSFVHSRSHFLNFCPFFML